MPPSLNEITTFPEKFSWIIFNSKSVSETLFFHIELGTFISVTTCLLISVYSASSSRIPVHQVVKSHREKSTNHASGLFTGKESPGRLLKRQGSAHEISIRIFGGRTIFGKNKCRFSLYILLYSVLQAIFNFRIRTAQVFCSDQNNVRSAKWKTTSGEVSTITSSETPMSSEVYFPKPKVPPETSCIEVLLTAFNPLPWYNGE